MLTMSGGRTAKLHYMANNYRMIAPGDHVLCGVTGEAIHLDDLRYWSVEKQEAYASAEIAVRAAEAAR
ncbi:DUF2093 domain-containing protein [Parasphingopyxis sp.]|uniref:DUF2093 domain-containing protein n=1 Tax=Parasphingopyxis sp. TaxID=1920299 RepID=UPI00261A6323|nr:DUF2093 domain-containing protein [Parasphingopyxis sp.]